MFEPASMAAIFFGMTVGVIFGIIPGLGSVIAMTLLLPFTFGWDPILAMYAFAGIMGTASTGGAVPASFLNTPGTIANVCTTFDGYPMAQRGEGGRALGQRDHLSGRCEHEDFVGKQIDLHCVEELVRVCELALPLEELT